MSKISKYKWLNIVLFLLVSGLALLIIYYVKNGYCIDRCGVDLMRSVINPIGSGAPWLAATLAILLVFPADLFRRWLFYAGGPFFILSVIDISTIDTRGGSIVSPTRAGMAELSGQLLLALTILFIVGYYGWFWYKNRRQNKQK